MRDERDVPEWMQALAALLGLVLALPFLYFMLVEWLAIVSLGGWFSYVMIGWAVLITAGFAWQVVAPHVARWYWIYRGRRVIRRSGTSAPGS